MVDLLDVQVAREALACRLGLHRRRTLSRHVGCHRGQLVGRLAILLQNVLGARSATIEIANLFSAKTAYSESSLPRSLLDRVRSSYLLMLYTQIVGLEPLPDDVLASWE